LFKIIIIYLLAKYNIKIIFKKIKLNYFLLLIVVHDVFFYKHYMRRSYLEENIGRINKSKW